MKFMVTVQDLTKAKGRGFEGEYKVLESGALKIIKSDGGVEYFSPSGWFWLTETGE
jgi:hypothetical protein